MSIALGKKILGVLIALGGVSVLSRQHDMADVITAIVMFAAGVALFFWERGGRSKKKITERTVSPRQQARPVTIPRQLLDRADELIE